MAKEIQGLRMLIEPNHLAGNATTANGSQMKINITVELDSDEFSLTELLAILFDGDTEVPVVETVETVAEEPAKDTVEVEEPKEDIPEVKVRTCTSCGTTETPQWRRLREDDGPMCNRCHFRIHRKEKKEAREAAKSASAPEPAKTETKPRGRKRRVVSVPASVRKKQPKSKIPDEPTLADIGGIVDSDRITLLKNSNVNSLYKFATQPLSDVAVAMGASENEMTDIENAQRVASALLRAYRLGKEALEQVEITPVKSVKPKMEKKEWKDDSPFNLVWEALPHGTSGVHFAHNIAASAVNVAERNYETPENVGDVLTRSAKDVFQKIERASGNGRFQFLDGGGNMVALVVLDDSKWPAMSVVKEA